MKLNLVEYGFGLIRADLADGLKTIMFSTPYVEQQIKANIANAIKNCTKKSSFSIKVSNGKSNIEMNLNAEIDSHLSLVKVCEL
ncbi:hypothetical protein A1QO_00680 [Vibrio genomosp. F10 str. ZF-129]|uniref:Uncharacterized protein n=1 Tax=Vibrio genomosp. F10 str. ZF-129 TaxID=1187848 RepID=A0A1E5BGB9_9VIBR|nr:hypothetical protein [Vibrio genomosp. F10]OEE35307.1 hypothetical protein A1QO_00680 [Vibrio genomosp. F10 str. ZF-129]